MIRMLSVAILAAVFSGPAAADVSLSGRSVADTCRFIYRIETDLVFEGLTSDTLTIWMRDEYENRLLPPQEVPVIDGAADVTLVTMSTNPRYLSREIQFAMATEHGAPAAPTHRANISALMRRCHDATQRDSLPYEALLVEPQT